MITCSNSPVLGSGIPNHYVGDLLHTIEISGLSRVRTELLPLAVIAALAPHPVQMHRQFPCHRDLCDLPSPAHRQMEEPAAPLGLTAHRNLRCFHQQKTQQHVALLADVTQATAFSTRFFRRHQPYIAGDLLAATKTFGISNHQLEGQGRKRTDSGMRDQSPVTSEWCCWEWHWRAYADHERATESAMLYSQRPLSGSERNI
jgi:hypothetical protein